jgi:transposase-like protein
MKKSKFSEEQIVRILKEVEAGAKVAETCRKHGISEPTYYVWKKGSPPISRTLTRRPIEALRSVHVEATEVQCGVQARCG